MEKQLEGTDANQQRPQWGYPCAPQNWRETQRLEREGMRLPLHSELSSLPSQLSPLPCPWSDAFPSSWGCSRNLHPLLGVLTPSIMGDNRFNSHPRSVPQLMTHTCVSLFSLHSPRKKLTCEQHLSGATGVTSPSSPCPLCPVTVSSSCVSKGSWRAARVR